MNGNLRKQSLKLSSFLESSSLGPSTKEENIIGINLHSFLGLCYFHYKCAFLAIFLTITVLSFELLYN